MLIDTDKLRDYNENVMDVDFRHSNDLIIQSIEHFAKVADAVVQPELCKCRVPKLPVGFTNMSNVKCEKCNHLLRREHNSNA